MKVFVNFFTLRVLTCLLYFILLPLNALTQSDSNGDTDLKTYQLKGPVKLLVEKTLKYRTADSAEIGYLVRTDSVWFNLRGKCTRRVVHDSIDKLTFSEYYSYNPQGQLVSAKWYKGPKKKKNWFEYRYYNKLGKCTLRKTFDWEKSSFSQNAFTYDRVGHCVSELRGEAELPLQPSNKLKYTHQTKYNYDSVGRLSTSKTGLNDNKVEAYQVCSYYYLENTDSTVIKWSRGGSYRIEIYNKEGNYLRWRNYSAVSNLEGFGVFTNSANGMQLSQQSYYHNELISDLKCAYFDFDRFNNFGSVHYTVDGRISQSRIHKVLYR